jgi:hypothetical protein
MKKYSGQISTGWRQAVLILTPAQAVKKPSEGLYHLPKPSGLALLFWRNIWGANSGLGDTNFLALRLRGTSVSAFYLFVLVECAPAMSISH